MEQWNCSRCNAQQGHSPAGDADYEADQGGLGIVGVQQSTALFSNELREARKPPVVAMPDGEIALGLSQNCIAFASQRRGSNS